MLPKELSEVAFEGSWRWIGPVPEDYSREFIDLSFSWSGRYGVISANTSLTEELERTGGYSRIENFKLKNAINHFYAEVKWRITDHGVRTIQKWNDSLIEDGVYYINTSHLDDPINLLIDNPKRVALLTTVVGEAHWFAFSANELITEVDNLIMIIEQELSR